MPNDQFILPHNPPNFLAKAYNISLQKRQGWHKKKSATIKIMVNDSTLHQENGQPPLADVVVIDFADLLKEGGVDSSLLSKLERAFGLNGPGLIAVRNVPGFTDAKKKFLPMAYDLVNLPEEYLESQVTDAKSLYNAGWSRGKEKLGDGEPDYAKGSFYFNPCTDAPGSPEDRKEYPLSYPCNVWPKEKLPDFEVAAKEFGMLLKEVTAKLAFHLDIYMQTKVKTYKPETLYQAMKETEKVKCRLLYYYPKDEEAQGKSGSWIGWHNDSGFLTALAGDFYLDHTTGKLFDSCPDDKAGLYIADRNDKLKRVVIPSDCMAIQLGECSQILSGGTVCATPHWVRSASARNVARISLAAFVDTPPDFPLNPPAGFTRAEICHSDKVSKRVPPLDKRWTDNGMTFGKFLEQTFQMYYDWTSS